MFRFRRDEPVRTSPIPRSQASRRRPPLPARAPHGESGRPGPTGAMVSVPAYQADDPTTRPRNRPGPFRYRRSPQNGAGPRRRSGAVVQKLAHNPRTAQREPASPLPQSGTNRRPGSCASAFWFHDTHDSACCNPFSFRSIQQTLSLDLFLQFFSRAIQTGLHRTLRNVEDFRNFTACEFLQIG